MHRVDKRRRKWHDSALFAFRNIKNPPEGGFFDLFNNDLCVALFAAANDEIGRIDLFGCVCLLGICNLFAVNRYTALFNSTSAFGIGRNKACL